MASPVALAWPLDAHPSFRPAVTSVLHGPQVPPPLPPALAQTPSIRARRAPWGAGPGPQGSLSRGGGLVAAALKHEGKCIHLSAHLATSIKVHNDRRARLPSGACLDPQRAGLRG